MFLDIRKKSCWNSASHKSILRLTNLCPDFQGWDQNKLLNQIFKLENRECNEESIVAMVQNQLQMGPAALHGGKATAHRKQPLSGRLSAASCSLRRSAWSHPSGPLGRQSHGAWPEKVTFVSFYLQIQRKGGLFYFQHNLSKIAIVSVFLTSHTQYLEWKYMEKKFYWLLLGSFFFFSYWVLYFFYNVFGFQELSFVFCTF